MAGNTAKLVSAPHARDYLKDGRGEGLTNMHRELEKCERALTEYLDMKKNVFPRFDAQPKFGFPAAVAKL